MSIPVSGEQHERAVEAASEPLRDGEVWSGLPVLERRATFAERVIDAYFASLREQGVCLVAGPEVERLIAGLADVRATCIAGANAIEPRNVIGRVIGIVDAALDGNWRI